MEVDSKAVVPVALLALGARERVLLPAFRVQENRE
jgi:hypothetical protein